MKENGQRTCICNSEKTKYTGQKSSHLTAVKEMQIKVIRRFILQPLDWKTLKKINSYQKPWERKCTLKYGHRRWNITLGKMAGSTA